MTIKQPHDLAKYHAKLHKIIIRPVQLEAGLNFALNLQGNGIESRVGDEIFSSRPDRPWGPHSPLYNVYQVFTRGKAA
jgi:hypothetical protein